MGDLAELDARTKRLEDLAAADEREISRLEDIEAIKRLKYKYFRTLDYKRWNEMAECFADDATTSYYDERYQPQGVDEIISFLSHAMGRATLFGIHHGHHPEIEITSDTTARGTWFLYNYMIDARDNINMLLAAVYDDEYVKVNGQWKIKHTYSTRLLEDRWERGDIPSLELTANMFAR